MPYSLDRPDEADLVASMATTLGPRAAGAVWDLACRRAGADDAARADPVVLGRCVAELLAHFETFPECPVAQISARSFSIRLQTYARLVAATGTGAAA